MGLGLTSYIPIVVYFLGIIVLFLTIFYKVEVGLILLVLLIPLQNIIDKIQRFPLGKDFIDILIIAMIIGWFIKSVTKKEKIFENSSFNLPIFFLMIVTLYGLLRGSSYLGQTYSGDLFNLRLQNWKNYMILPILYFISVNNVKNFKTLKILILLMAVTMIPMDYLFYNSFRWFSHEHYHHSIRQQGTFSYLGSNELAAFYAQYSLLLLGIFLFDNVKKRKILFISVLILNTYCLIFSYSRAAYFATIVSLFFVGLFKSKKLLLLLLISLFFWQFIIPASVHERITMTQNEEGELDSSTQSRFPLANKAIELFQESPILGVGYNVFSYLPGMDLRDPHNMYLKSLAETGIVGIAIYLLLYFLAIRSGWRLYNSSQDMFLKGLGFGFIFCVITNMLLNITHDNWSYFNLMGYYWILLGLIERANIMENSYQKN